MMKKIISFICCLFPIGANAADAIVYDSTHPGSSHVVNADGLTVNNVYVGVTDPVTGALADNFYVGDNANANKRFDIVSTDGGAITVNSILNIAQDWNLSIGGLAQNPANVTLGVDANAAVNAIGGLTLQNINTLKIGGPLIAGTADATTGAVDIASGGVNISANTIDAGAITINGGGTKLSPHQIQATGNFKTAQLKNNGGYTVVNAGSMDVVTTTGDDGTVSGGSIENMNTGGTLELYMAGALNIGADLENSGSMIIQRNTAGNVVDVVIGGTLKNDSAADGSTFGTMNVMVDSLRINGGTGADASLVNKGDMYLTISGETYLANGIDLSSMGAANVFSLETGTLTINNMTDLLHQAGSVNIKVTNGGMAFNNIENDAEMLLSATQVNITKITNNSNLNISTINSGDIIVSQDIEAAAGANTTINATGNLQAAGVGNAGVMELTGKTVNILGDVSNTGQSLQILATTDTAGDIHITGNVTNAGGDNTGVVTINSRQVEIDGVLTSNSGTTNIVASDSNANGIKIGSIVTNGGVLNMDALVGVDVTNGVNISNGALNFSDKTRSFTATESINIGGAVTVGGAAGTAASAGDVNIAASGVTNFVMKSTDGVISVADGISTIDDGNSRGAQFVASNIIVGELDATDNTIVTKISDVTANKNGRLIFGASDSYASALRVTGDINVNQGGTVDLYVNGTTVSSLNVNGLLRAHGANITADGENGINIDASGAGIWFGAASPATNPIPEPTSGMVVKDTSTLTLATTADGADIVVKGYVLAGTGKSLTLTSADEIDITGIVYSNGVMVANAATVAKFASQINNTGTLNVNAKSVDAYSLNNNGSTASAIITATGGDIVFVDAVSSSGSMALNAVGNNVKTGAFEVSGGTSVVTASALDSYSINVTNGGALNLNTANVTVSTNGQFLANNNINVAGNMVQGGATTGALNLTQNNTTVAATNLNVTGEFLANSNTATYDIGEDIGIMGGILVSGTGADVTMNAKNISTEATTAAGDVINAGKLTLNATETVALGDVINNSGTITLNSPVANVDSFSVNAGNAVLNGGELISAGAIVGGNLRQLSNTVAGSADIDVISDNYKITSASTTVNNILQGDGRLQINTGRLDVAGNIDVTNLRIGAQSADNWLIADIKGNVSNNTEFVGLKHMNIGGNYYFNNNSMLHAAILPYKNGTTQNNESPYNYWATVSLNDDSTLGKITNGVNGEALIEIKNKFISNIDPLPEGNGMPLQKGHVGIDLFSIVDQGTAIWLLHAENGLEELGTEIRNLNVNFCNADASLCFNYLDSLSAGAMGYENSSDEKLPIYISVRDSDDDGVEDSLYIVFDPRFGGPVEVFKIQPIVGREENHTKGEYVSAGALDNLIQGQLYNKGFYNTTPIEAIPLIFRDTNLATMGNELYKRMEAYNLNRDGMGLTRFSRLFQVHELDQIAGSVALNEHTSFRDFEDRMLDEFIWNRNRNLKKAWLDFDFGIFSQNVSDDKTVDGNRFSVFGGFDWQSSQTLILGLSARASYMSGKNDDSFNVGYRAGEFIAGNVDVDVSDINIGIGGYLLKTLGDKMRLYANAFLDVHLLDVSREQTYIDGKIEGDGTAFSLVSEWGLMHDWLNQYIVGNAYARIGYNTGFSVTEKVAGDEYMKLESDGYMILTPGYSLTFQKRIYPSAWFQIRPYASAGVEYDVLGTPDKVKYKFALVRDFTDYDVKIDSLWAYAGGGVEMLSVSGFQVGLDYRYQYNADIQMHNIKVSASYRF